MTSTARREGYATHNFSNNPRLLKQDVQRRLGLFIGGQFAATNLSSVMIKDRKSGAEHFKLEMWSAPGRSKPTFEEAKQKLDGGSGHKVEEGVKFGPSWTHHWLKMTINIPASWSRDQVELNFDPSCEAMLFNEAGDSLQGITGGFDYNRRVEYIIPKNEVKAGRCVRYIEVSANGMFGLQPEDQADPNVFYSLETVEIVIVNAEARALAYDFEILQQLSQVLPDHSPLGNQSRTAANDVMNAFRGRLEDVPGCRKIAQRILGTDWESEYEVETGQKPKPQNGNLWAIGYCHIDTAWLWPWSSTKQKIARSWSSQLDLLDRYPEFRFMATAAQHFRWLEDLYPQVFKRLQAKVKSGQFEINGGCWVEMDGNLPSGESFCRQFLYGQRYFESRFGKRTNVLILPDTFGFSPSLPQIARLSGCEYYFSNRVGLDTIDKFPFTSFNWVGLDGSQLLSHVTPINRYDSLCTVDEIVKGNSNHMNLEASPDAVLAFGHGDGGGGPRPLLLERLRRVRAAGKAGGGQSQELPLIKQGATLSEFFEHLLTTTDNGKRLPDWHGEIFLQAMRGVLTSQSRTKRNFRKSEVLMREVELLSTLASIQTDFAYPKERIDETWESLCLCMFHDTLPGSSIRLAVQDYDAEFARIQATGKEMRESAIKALQTRDLDLGSKAVLNTLPGVARCEVVCVNGEHKVATAETGQLQATISSPKTEHVATIKATDDGVVMQNATLRVHLKQGRLVSIYDKTNHRELLAPGRTAGFTINQDQPYGGDAWAIEQYDLASFEDLNWTMCDIVSHGPARVSVKCSLETGKSHGTAVISLDGCGATAAQDSLSLLRLDCAMEWRDRHRLLKFELPLSFYSDFATYDAAFGVHRRPTTRNTTWEANKFEGAGHKFADYSEYGYGVALLNDCKYGYGIQGNTMTLSLLRAPTQPDEEADQGHHDFSFAVYPHRGTYAESDVQEVAHAFNNPLQVISTALSPESASVPFKIEGASNVLLETIKRGEEDFDALTYKEKRQSNKIVILRLHEHMGGRACVKLAVHKLQITKAEIVNILEDSLDELDVTTYENKEEIDLGIFRAFEVKTVKLYF